MLSMFIDIDFEHNASINVGYCRHIYNIYKKLPEIILFPNCCREFKLVRTSRLDMTIWSSPVGSLCERGASKSSPGRVTSRGCSSWSVFLIPLHFLLLLLTTNHLQQCHWKVGTNNKNQEWIQTCSVVDITDPEVGCIPGCCQFLVKFKFPFVTDQSRSGAAVDLVVIRCRLGPPCTICPQAFGAGGGEAPSSFGAGEGRPLLRTSSRASPWTPGDSLQGLDPLHRLSILCRRQNPFFRPEAPNGLLVK